MTFFRRTPGPDPGWPPARRRRYWLWQYLWVTAAGVGLGALSLLLAVGPYDMAVFWGYWTHPDLLALNLLPVVALLWLLYALLRRAWLAYLLEGLAVLTLSAGNYYKLMFRDDPLLAGDLALLKEAGNMAGRYRLFLDFKLALALACAALGAVLLALLVRGRPPKGARLRAISGLLGGAVFLGLFPILTDQGLYDRAAHYETIESPWSATQQYLAHGLVYPFLHSLNDAFETPPPGYNAARAQALAAAFPDADIPEEKKVNVVCIMLEAFQDFSRFGTPELERDVYARYHELEAESYRGDLVTNIFAGGTVDTERCFLTGYSQLTSFRANTNAYPWYFRSQGYQTTGYHPCMGWFYNRVNINERLGFQEYYFMENLFGQWSGDPDGTMALDNVFFPVLTGELSWRQAGPPIFSFSVTYQGHGPYTDSECYWGEVSDYISPDAPYTPEEQCILANYFGSVEDTANRLADFKDFLAAQEEPYLLVVFGDHNPWMGDGNSIYEAMGLNLDQSTQEGFANYYSTRYLIWANDLAKQALGNDFVGEGPALGPYFLMDKLFELCGWEGPGFLQGTQAVAQRVSVQHESGIYLESGVFTPDLSPEGAALSQDYDFLQYYDRHHFRYSHLIP